MFISESHWKNRYKSLSENISRHSVPRARLNDLGEDGHFRSMSQGTCHLMTLSYNLFREIVRLDKRKPTLRSTWKFFIFQVFLEFFPKMLLWTKTSHFWEQQAGMFPTKSENVHDSTFFLKKYFACLGTWKSFLGRPVKNFSLKVLKREVLLNFWSKIFPQISSLYTRKWAGKTRAKKLSPKVHKHFIVLNNFKEYAAADVPLCMYTPYLKRLFQQPSLKTNKENFKWKTNFQVFASPTC